MIYIYIQRERERRRHEIQYKLQQEHLFAELVSLTSMITVTFVAFVVT
jgi:hypothetical protein